MGIWINEPVFHDPQRIDRAVETLADTGFGIVRLFLRNCNFTHRSPETVSLVERAVIESRIDAGRLVNRLGSSRVLFVPYALAMPRNAFEVCMEFAKSGGRVVFVGTPIAFDEVGQSLLSDFAWQDD